MRTVVLAVLFAALPAASASAQTQIQGLLTINGSEGRDDLTIDATSGGQMAITPAVTTTAEQGACVNDTDPTTGRPIRTRCSFRFDRPTEIVIDLRGGNDELDATVELTRSDGVFGLISLITASGGAGNDSIWLRTATDRVMLGGDGDDVLVAPGSRTLRSEVIWDGGSGRDLADFSESYARTAIDSNNFGDLPLSLVASLSTKTATLLRPPRPDFNETAPTEFATDDLFGIERL